MPKLERSQVRLFVIVLSFVFFFGSPFLRHWVFPENEQFEDWGMFGKKTINICRAIYWVSGSNGEMQFVRPARLERALAAAGARGREKRLEVRLRSREDVLAINKRLCASPLKDQKLNYTVSCFQNETWRTTDANQAVCI